MSALILEDKVKNNRDLFVRGVRVVAAALSTDPNFLMAVMWAESRLNPQAQNTRFPLSGGFATGLIQFTPDTARALGTSVDALYHMSNVEQLPYIEKYFRPYAGRLKTYFDVYAAVFFPAAIGKADTWVFETSRLSRSRIAAMNPVIDLDSNGEITVGEFKKYLENSVPVKLRKLIFYAGGFIGKNPGLSVLVILSLLLMLVYGSK